MKREQKLSNEVETVRENMPLVLFMLGTLVDISVP